MRSKYSVCVTNDVLEIDITRIILGQYRKKPVLKQN